MEKKYYDIIVSLIKQNKKFPGCEPILEDIARDVYEHSIVVLESVTNEDVISAYLNKVVATSLITVPKKLNFNTRNKHRLLSNIEALSKVTIQPEPAAENITSTEEPEPEKSEFSNPDIVEEPSHTISEPLEEHELDAVQEELCTEEAKPEGVELVSIPEEDISVEDNFINDSKIEQTSEPEGGEEELELLTFDTGSDVDKTLVDKMINGCPDNTDNTDNLEEEEEEFDILDTTTVFETEEKKEDNTTIEELELTEENTEQINDDLPETSENTLELDIQDTETFELSPIIDDTIEEAPLDEFVSDELPVQEEDTTEDLELFEPSDDSGIITPEEEDSSELISFDTDNSFKAEEQEETISPLPDFEYFNYEPDIKNIDEKEICTSLTEFDEKHPEKKLLEICKLKYEENRSVSEIAEALNFSVREVLDTLNDIIELVKD